MLNRAARNMAERDAATRRGGRAAGYALQFNETRGFNLRVEDLFSLPIKEDAEEVVIQQADGSPHVPGWSA